MDKSNCGTNYTTFWEKATIKAIVAKKGKGIHDYGKKESSIPNTEISSYVGYSYAGH